MDEAECGGLGSEIFFEDEHRQLALKICTNCKVQEPCLAYAAKTNAEGVWGGTTAHQRREYGIIKLRKLESGLEIDWG